MAKPVYRVQAPGRRIGWPEAQAHGVMPPARADNGAVPGAGNPQLNAMGPPGRSLFPYDAAAWTTQEMGDWFPLDPLARRGNHALSRPDGSAQPRP